MRIDDQGSLVNLSVSFSPTHTSLRSILRPRLLIQTPFPGSGMPIQVHSVLPRTISGTELSRVRTELYQLRILPSSSPHPVQTNPQPASHGYFRDIPLPAHGQVSIATSPVRITTYRRLCCLHQQEAQQGTALLADVSQSLFAATGVLARNHPHITADLLGTSKARWRSDDQHIGECREWAYAGMRHQLRHFGPFPGFFLDGCG